MSPLISYTPLLLAKYTLVKSVARAMDGFTVKLNHEVLAPVAETALTSTEYNPDGSSLEMVKAWCQSAFWFSLHLSTMPVLLVFSMAVVASSLSSPGPAAANMLASRLPLVP